MTDYVHSLSGDKAIVTASAKHFPVLAQGGAGMQRITIGSGHLLTPHWHPNTTETTYCLAGSGIVGLAIPDTCDGPVGATYQQYPYKKDDIVFLPQGYAHFFANTSSEDLVLLLTFANSDFDILTLADTLQRLPEGVVIAAENSQTKAGSSPIIPYTKLGEPPSC